MASVRSGTDSRGVTTLTLDRPERHNALDADLIDEIRHELDAVERDTRVLVLAGSGKSFCAGADLAWMRASIDLSDADNRREARNLSDMLHALDTLACPTIARVHGAAIGGGAGLVACCDIAIAGDSASFGFSEVRLGLVPATISPFVLAAIGKRRARRWFQTGERFDGLEAYRMGLVHDLCSDADLGRRVEERLAGLLASGPEAQAASKRLIADIAGRPIDDALRADTVERLATVRAGDEAQEGLAAFLDKREPAWRR